MNLRRLRFAIIILVVSMITVLAHDLDIARECREKGYQKLLTGTTIVCQIDKDVK